MEALIPSELSPTVLSSSTLLRNTCGRKYVTAVLNSDFSANEVLASTKACAFGYSLPIALVNSCSVTPMSVNLNRASDVSHSNPEVICLERHIMSYLLGVKIKGRYRRTHTAPDFIQSWQIET